MAASLTGMVSRGAMKYSCVSLYPCLCEDLVLFYSYLFSQGMLQRGWFSAHEKGVVAPSLWAELMCSFAVALWSCLHTHDLEDILSTHSSSVCHSHTLHNHNLRATSAEVGASFSGWLQIVYSCSWNSLPVCLWPALLSLSRSRHMGTNEVSEEVHVCAFVYAHFFITNRAGSSVYLKLPGTSHYKI